MKKSKLVLFFRNTLIAYLSIGVLILVYSLAETVISPIKVGTNFIFGGLIIGLITVWVAFKPATKSHRNLSQINFDREFIKKKRAEEKPVEFIAFAVLLASALISATGFLITK